MSDIPEVVEKQEEQPIPYEAVLIGAESTDTDNDSIYKSLTAPDEGTKQGKPDATKPVAPRDFDTKRIANPTFDVDAWALMPDFSTRLSQSIRLYARNTVGLGWKVQPVIPVGKNSTPELRERYEYEKTALLDLLEKPNSEAPFSDLMFMNMTDKLTLGNGYIEVVRNQSGYIVELYHAKAKNIRVLKDGDGFVQRVGNKFVYFKNFGEKRNMDRTTGKFGGRVPLKKRASEIIHYKEYNTRDDFYGVPRYMSTAPCIMGNRAASERNLAFFENDAVPRMALLIAGGKLSSGSVDKIQKFFKAAKGTKNAHRMMVIQIDTEGANLMGSTAKPEVQLKPLTVGENDDASFLKYRSANDEEIRESFGIARAFFSPDDVNKAVAYATKAITNEQEFDPTQEQVEHLLYYTIIMDMFSGEHAIAPKEYASTVDKAKKYLSKKEISNIQKAHFGGIFFEKSNKTEEEMCLEKDYVIDMVESTKLYKFLKIRKDSNGESVLIFKTLPLVRVIFNRPKVLDEAEKSEVNERYLETGVFTPNEIRQQLGVEAYPDEMNFGDTPLPVYELEGEIETEGVLTGEPEDSQDGGASSEEESEQNTNSDNEDNEGEDNGQEES